MKREREVNDGMMQMSSQVEMNYSGDSATCLIYDGKIIIDLV